MAHPLPSERRTEDLLIELLTSQGWDKRRPPSGNVLRQHEYRAFPHLSSLLGTASKSGAGFGLPEAVIVERGSTEPLVVVEAKSDFDDLNQAMAEARHYANHFIKAGHATLAAGIAGTSDEAFGLRVEKWVKGRWAPITYDKNPISWIPNPADINLVVAGKNTELRPTIPPPDVLAKRADEINRLLREARIKDELRPAVVGAIMLALWSSGGDIRKSKDHILSDINRACQKAFWQAKKQDLAESLRVDEANEELAVKARRIVKILELLNVSILTAEHDYLGQLYETFFRYTGGNTIGQYFTPRHVTEFMADMTQLGKSDVVLDPACGTGGFLISAMYRILTTDKISRSELVKIVRDRLIGIENEPITAALCVANMILRGDGSTSIYRGNCFTLPDYSERKATISLMNPPFPHKKTDVPAERFVERALEGLRLRGKLAVILPTSLLVKSNKGKWREKILRRHTLVAVAQLPDELFQPYASSTTCVVLLEKGVPHTVKRKTVFVRIAYDGLTLKKSARVERADGRNQIPDACDAIQNKRIIPGFSGLASIIERDEWAVGAYITSNVANDDELRESADILLRRLASFYVRYAKEVVAQRAAVRSGDIDVVPYRSIVTASRLANAAKLSTVDGTIGGMFDILYGMKELHSREGIPSGQTLIISPTEEYNGTYDWLSFSPALQPPFVTAAQTGSIGESFVQLEACAVNDDCLILLPKNSAITIPQLFLAAAVIRLERWRFTYGRKLTPSRISEFKLPVNEGIERWISKRLEAIRVSIDAALRVYQK